jgi:hypothetical protein
MYPKNVRLNAEVRSALEAEGEIGGLASAFNVGRERLLKLR